MVTLLLSSIGTAFLSVYVLYIFYLAVMNLKRARDEGTASKVALALGYPILIIGLLLDWLVNVLIFTLLFLELPGEPYELVTGRLKRHAYGNDGWRKTFARWFADHLLDPFDPSGKHI
jgi:hypothetical protein